MKHIDILKSFLSIAFLIVIVVMFDSCKGGGDDPVRGPGTGNNQTESDRVSGLLTSSPWKIKSLTIDGVSKNLYPNLAVTFTKTGFTSTGGTSVWPATGSWTFTDDTATSFKRDDQTVVAIETIDQNNLTMSLTWSQTSLGPGRVSSVAGKHVFVMGK
ncbi:MAG: hypothetical protein WDO15_10170 [Bacteroidota bacterium]